MMMVKSLVIVCFFSSATFVACSFANILYPVESESRELRTLHGLWNFKISPLFNQMVGFEEKWYTKRFDTVSFCKNNLELKYDYFV